MTMSLHALLLLVLCSTASAGRLPAFRRSLTRHHPQPAPPTSSSIKPHQGLESAAAPRAGAKRNEEDQWIMLRLRGGGANEAPNAAAKQEEQQWVMLRLRGGGANEAPRAVAKRRQEEQQWLMLRLRGGA